MGFSRLNTAVYNSALAYVLLGEIIGEEALVGSQQLLLAQVHLLESAQLSHQ